MDSLLQVLIRRDGMDRSEAQLIIKEARDRCYAGEDPEEILYEEFGLEPDYIFDLI